MKPLLTLVRNMIVGLCWSIFFIEGVRVIMLRNWRFDIFNSDHWNYAWELWLKGVVIRSPKEWAFILILLTFIPLLLTGWAALCLLPWEEVFRTVFMLPLKLFNKIFAKPVTAIKNTASIKAVKKKKSYKEIRPRALRMPISETAYDEPQTAAAAPAKPIKTLPQPTPIPPAPLPLKAPAAEPIADKFDHSLFQFDDEEDFDFNFDAFEDKPEPVPAPAAPAPLPAEKNSTPPCAKNKDQPKNGKKAVDKQQNDKNAKNLPASKPAETGKPRSGNSVLDIIRQKGWEVITSATVRNNLIDFIGVSSNQICLCLLDKESGDWLADEERFNDEEPLWFSESSHRISPVRKVDLARQALIAKLADSGLEYEVSAYVVIQIGNIINAEDMFEIWNNMNISVTRIDRGSPKELKLFSKSLSEVETPIDKDSFEKIKKLVRNIA